MVTATWTRRQFVRAMRDRQAKAGRWGKPLFFVGQQVRGKNLRAWTGLTGTVRSRSLYGFKWQYVVRWDQRDQWDTPVPEDALEEARRGN